MAYPVTHLREKRSFLPLDFVFESWEQILPWFEQLEQESPQSLSQFKAWLRKWNELSTLLEEDLAWKYIRMTCNTSDEIIRNAYEQFIREVLPNVSLQNEKLQRRYKDSPYRKELTQPEYQIFDRNLIKDLELFREENIPIQTEINSKAQEFGALSGAMTIDHEGKTLTLPQANALLEEHNPILREDIWRKVAARRFQDKEKLHILLDELSALRTQEALQAGFPSFTEYKFQQLGRFDYTIQDCLNFHTAVEKVVKPIYESLMQERKTRLKLESLKPWDLSVDIYGTEPLKPFESSQDLIEKSGQLFQRIRPELAEMITTLNEMGHLDLESRPAKAPGGYNHPLAETGAPFIFMNAAGTQDDMNTLMHEAGHAFHSFLTHPLELNEFKNTPSEIAELASMSMELISSSEWNIFYPDTQDCLRARIDHLGNCLSLLCWVATVDSFQHWLYADPNHSHTERENAWIQCYKRFQGDAVDWTGLEKELAVSWQRQLHIYEVPFYYIEYGLAQLGALGVWKNYLQNPSQAVDQYLSALKLGYTRSIPEVYQTAGVQFDFSEKYIREILSFGLEHWNEMKNQLVG